MNYQPTYEELSKRVEALEREVVECRQAEQAALAELETYRNAIENAVWGVFQTTPEGRFLRANQATAKIFGYETPDELKSSITDIGNQLYVKPEQRDEMLRRVVKENVILAFEAQVHRKDKRIIWISISIRAVKAPDGKLIYIEGFVEDITERKRVEKALKESEEKLLKAHDTLELRVAQRTAELAEMNESLKRENSERKAAEEALLESEDRYRSLIENLPIGIYRNTPGAQGRFIMANPVIARMFGYETVDRFLQTSVADLYWNPADRQVFSEKLIAQGHLVSEELQLRKFDGTPLWGAVTVNVVHDAAGEIKYFDGLIEDISDRKQTEEALRESEKRFQSVMEGAPDPIVVYNTKGETSYLNPAFTQVFGWTLDELRSRKIDYVPKECLPETKMMIEKINRGESIHGVETRRFTKSGEVLDISISAAVLHDSQGDQTGQITTLRDISERKQVDKILRKEREKFRILVEEAPLGVSLIAKNGHYEYLNPRFIEIFGYTLESTRIKSSKKSPHF
jgi:PAS domain S-box-containing protein